jgi:hypothetical protein
MKQGISWRQADAAISAVLLEDAPIDYALVDPSWLETVLGDVADAANGLLEDSKVELALAADIVLEDVGHRHEGIFASGKEHLGRPIVWSASYIKCRG